MHLTPTLLEKPKTDDLVIRERVHQAAFKEATKPRSKERNYRAGRALLALLVVVAGADIHHRLTEPSTKTVDVLVQPYDNPTTVAQRAEDRFGKDAGDFNIHQEAMRLADNYGVLHAGEHLKVHVK
jgi:hypothetical protein